MRKAFTLAEVMIVLTVIGVLTAILMPIAHHSIPDKNVMKFKKANTTLGTVITELVTSGQYNHEGDLGKMTDGSLITSSTHFCNSIADVMNTKSVSCSTAGAASGTIAQIIVATSVNGAAVGLNTYREKLDEYCKKDAREEIIDASGVVWYQVGANRPFGYKDSAGAVRWFPSECKDGSINHCATFTYTNPSGYTVTETYDGAVPQYKVFCLDVDGINQGEDPFGYGIRADGKMLYGARALEWIDKKIQRGE